VTSDTIHTSDVAAGRVSGRAQQPRGPLLHERLSGIASRTTPSMTDLKPDRLPPLLAIVAMLSRGVAACRWRLLRQQRPQYLLLNSRCVSAAASAGARTVANGAVGAGASLTASPIGTVMAVCRCGCFRPAAHGGWRLQATCRH
jgi:hypothetical protein